MSETKACLTDEAIIHLQELAENVEDYINKIMSSNYTAECEYQILPELINWLAAIYPIVYR